MCVLSAQLPAPTTFMMSARLRENRAILVVVESGVIKLDVEDTLRELGLRRIQATALPSVAVSLLGQYRFDAAILGLETTGPAARFLASNLDRLSIPVLVLENGPDPMQGISSRGLKRLVSVPFDTETLLATLDWAFAAQR